jgi:hypothetical protein
MLEKMPDEVLQPTSSAARPSEAVTASAEASRSTRAVLKSSDERH